MAEMRALSAEGLTILEALIDGAGSRLLSDSVMRSLAETGLVEQHGDGWLITEAGLRSIEEARQRLSGDPQVNHGIG